MYADHTHLTYVSNSIEDIERTSSQDFANVSNWLKAKRLTLTWAVASVEQGNPPPLTFVPEVQYFGGRWTFFVQCFSKHVYGICCKTVTSSALCLYY